MSGVFNCGAGRLLVANNGGILVSVKQHIIIFLCSDKEKQRKAVHSLHGRVCTRVKRV